MYISVNYHSGVLQKTGWVRVGHNSSLTNQDAVWSFSITPQGENIASIDSLRFHFRWDNDAAGSGWRTNFRYVARIRRDSPTGAIIKEFGQNLEGANGNWDVPREELGLSPNTTYYITLNVKNNDDGSAPLSSMKAFSTTATADIVSWTSATGKCAPPTEIRLNGTTNHTYAKPGTGVQMEILGGGGGLNNPFQKWFIQELILSHDSQELTGWRQARNANDVPDPAVYNPTARIVTVYPTPTRGQRKRFRIRAEGIPNEAYHSDFKEMEPHVCSNRLPNDCTNVMPNKTNAPPGGIIRLIFSGGGDPDNNLVRYQARVMDESGALYNGGTPIGQQLDITKNYIDLTLSGDPSTFQAGTKWKFQVQGVDECEAGSWSIASPLVELRGITRVKVNGVWKQAIPYVKINGAWKQAVPYEKHNGMWEVAT